MLSGEAQRSHRCRAAKSSDSGQYPQECGIRVPYRGARPRPLPLPPPPWPPLTARRPAERRASAAALVLRGTGSMRRGHVSGEGSGGPRRQPLSRSARLGSARVLRGHRGEQDPTVR
eukprot:gene11520-biopygen2975